MQVPARIVLASANPKKVAELSTIFAELGLGDVQLVPRPAELDDVEETEPDFEGNARLKAAAVASATSSAALADDSGLEVDALDGAPGVRSARYAGVDDATERDAANVAKLFAELARVGADSPSTRRARFRACVVLRTAEGDEVVVEGTVEGHIAPESAGESGFGYDPVFVPDEGDGRTFAQMAPEEKHSISHRGRALRALAARLS